MWIWGDSNAFKNSHKYTGFKKPPRCWLRNELNCPKLSCWADTRTKCMPSKLVKASQDKESNLPRVNICPLFQVPNYEHTHTHTGTHTQRHTHRNTHTKEHSYRNTHIYGWAGQPSQRGLRSKVWGSDGVPGFYHMHSRLDQGLLQHAFLQLCHPLGQRNQCWEWGRSRVHTYKGWNQVKANGQGFCSTTLGPTQPGRVGAATEHWRNQCSHWALALASTSPSYQLKSCQQALGRGDLWPAQLQLCPKACGHPVCIETHLHKDTPTRLEQETFSTNFMETEEIKHNEKTEEFVSSETIRKTHEKIC